MKKGFFYLFIFIVTFLHASNKEIYEIEDSLIWTESKIYYTTLDSIEVLNFVGASYDFPDKTPRYFNELNKIFENPKASILQFEGVYVPLTFKETELISVNSLSSELRTSIKVVNKKSYVLLNIIPFRVNPNGKFEKLISFTCKIQVNDFPSLRMKRSNNISSVLALGDWYKIGVQNTGVHKIDYNFINSLGINPATINPSQIKLYGNGGGMLPEKNNEFRYDGLQENSIFVKGDEDGVFDSNDYILFFGESQDTWTYNMIDSTYLHQINLYTDTTYYFLNFNNSQGKRIQLNEAPINTANIVVDSYDACYFHELEERNIKNTGRQWFGEYFGLNSNHQFPFYINNLDFSTSVKIKVRAVAHSIVPTSYDVFFNSSNYVGNIPISAVSGSSTADYVKDGVLSTSFLPTSNNIDITVNYNNTGNSSALGWLDYIELVARRSLIMDENQKLIMDQYSVGTNNVTQFILENAEDVFQIWDVTNSTNVKEVKSDLLGSNLEFSVKTDSLRKFIAFKNTQYLTPDFISQVANQNLHAAENIDYIIVTPKVFLSQAQQLAEFHSNKNGLNVFVTTTSQIYNEFSSGSQDITAIRDFIRMLYNKASNSEEEPKYLLLFGDASYDFKNRIAPNTNFVPVYQPFESYSLYNSFATDDYYGFLDFTEGNNMTADYIDIGIGRFPVKTVEEAQVAVDKVISYSNNDSFGDWRNKIAIVADDADDAWEQILVNGAEDIAQKIDTTFKQFNIKKIYTDAYTQEITPGGERYPQANNDINKSVEEGVLLINYVGHGGEIGWATERILNLSDINGWTNNDNMTVFITITCEFSRLDDPGIVSAGEQAFLNPEGAAIALFSTTRVVYVGPGSNLNNLFYNHVFERENGNFLAFGEIMKRTKNNIMDSGKRNYSLLGDPALQIACPKYNVVTTSINGVDVSLFNDTINALSLVTVSGEITDENNNILSDFNGVVYPTVFDKPIVRSTLDNNNQSASITFSEQQNILYRGAVDAIGGNFTFSFVVPMDISYDIDFGKISYYANDDFRDATGYYNQIKIGGSNPSAPTDTVGPIVNLYMNNENFLFGGITDENPFIYATIYDENGINTAGTGIGHDIVAILDEETSSPLILNNYYTSNLNSYQSGRVVYPLNNLEDGYHSVSLKVWDVFNNSAEDYTEFIVVSSGEMAIEQVLNYPNPFSNQTTFQFEHNKPNEPLRVTIDVFTLDGDRVKTISEDITNTGYRVNNITWDGKDDTGGILSNGIYVYRVKVKSMLDNSRVYRYEKLVLIR